MKTYYDCLPCFLNQAISACRSMDLDRKTTRQIIDAVAALIPRIPMESSPPETGRHVYRIIREISGNPDPYKEIKTENTQKALALYPMMVQMVKDADDPLSAAIKIATAGNVIDCGVNKPYAVEEEIYRIMDNDFAIFDIDSFRRHLELTDRILYIGDNAGECVFDRVLIETMEKPVTYVVRDCPVINDATVEDAVAAGIDRVADIVTSGTDAPGTVLATCSEDFLKLFNEPNMKISKGQGNYEALSACENNSISFLLKAKCSVVARDLDVREGQMILKQISV